LTPSGLKPRLISHRYSMGARPIAYTRFEGGAITTAGVREELMDRGATWAELRLQAAAYQAR
jgi:hypothetical protein